MWARYVASVTSNFLWPYGLQPARLLCPWDSPGKNTGVVYHSLLQGIFLTQGQNQGLLHCRRILDYLSHQGKPGKSVGKSRFMLEKPDKHTLARWSTPASTVTSRIMAWITDTICWEGPFVSTVSSFLKTHHPGLFIRKTPDKPPLRNITENFQQAFCKTVRVIKNKNFWETVLAKRFLRGWMGQLTVMW